MSKNYKEILENFLFDCIHDDEGKIIINKTAYNTKELHDAIELNLTFQKFIENQFELKKYAAKGINQ